MQSIKIMEMPYSFFFATFIADLFEQLIGKRSKDTIIENKQQYLPRKEAKKLKMVVKNSIHKIEEK